MTLRAPVNSVPGRESGSVAQALLFTLSLEGPALLGSFAFFAVIPTGRLRFLQTGVAGSWHALNHLDIPTSSAQLSTSEVAL
jgi:hypothetical protein